MSTDTGSRKAISGRLRAFRKRLGKTQAAMGKAVGLSQRGWANYENGQSLPSPAVIQSLVSKYELNANWLFTGIGSSSTTAIPREMEVTSAYLRLRNEVAELTSIAPTLSKSDEEAGELIGSLINACRVTELAALQRWTAFEDSVNRLSVQIETVQEVLEEHKLRANKER